MDLRCVEVLRARDLGLDALSLARERRPWKSNEPKAVLFERKARVKRPDDECRRCHSTARHRVRRDDDRHTTLGFVQGKESDVRPSPRY